jgi:DHA1 family multidrug resistance protein-like MFS transporter
MWEILWMSAPVYIAWFFFLPETSAANILLRRAARLRKSTGNERIRSQTEIDRQGITFKEIAIDALIKPMEITIKDPAVSLSSFWTIPWTRVFANSILPGAFRQVCSFAPLLSMAS